MARMRVFIVLALAIAAGGTFAFGTYRYMQNVPTRTVGGADEQCRRGRRGSAARRRAEEW